MNRRNYGGPAPHKKFPGMKPVTPIRTPERPPRNKDCPCQSGRKYKHCCKDIPTLIETLSNKHCCKDIPTLS